eukprot:1177280-Prorocentrum_minimum.AAC.1
MLCANRTSVTENIPHVRPIERPQLRIFPGCDAAGRICSAHTRAQVSLSLSSGAVQCRRLVTWHRRARRWFFWQRRQFPNTDAILRIRSAFLTRIPPVLRTLAPVVPKTIGNTARAIEKIPKNIPKNITENVPEVPGSSPMQRDSRGTKEPSGIFLGNRERSWFSGGSRGGSLVVIHFAEA